MYARTFLASLSMGYQANSSLPTIALALIAMTVIGPRIYDTHEKKNRENTIFLFQELKHISLQTHATAA